MEILFIQISDNVYISIKKKKKKKKKPMTDFVVQGHIYVCVLCTVYIYYV